MTMNIIVTGGAGFVGSHLVQHLISKNYFPIIIDNLSSGNYANIKKFIDSGKAKFLKIDIRNFHDVLKIPHASTIVHLAAIASVVESIKNPTYVNDVNVTGTLNMLELCRKKNIKKFVFASSAAIFGNYDKKLSESSPIVPSTVYGSTKFTGEQYCRIYAELFGIKSVALRPFNIYGPRQNNAYAGVISKFMSRIVSNKPPVIFGDGRQTRDFIHVADVANAFEKAISYKNHVFDVFNLGTGKTISVNQLAKIFLKLAKKEYLKPIHKYPVPGVVIHNSTSINKIKNTLKFKPKVTLSEGISKLLNKT